ncbi:hypothetical protein EOE18_02170 [Novosphingobium umbonatum]|uniref:LysR family transcriptional regulator n=2 Tax=Novosphingobium umbonatum TaxID=1908524 RepID=A0A437NDM1_9SPHN|nr:hypothetical protein EOE18_02170 [Novosphingobium umbonatum]
MTAPYDSTAPDLQTSKAKKSRRRVPAFAPVPVRGRRDGWSVGRQAGFMAALARTGSVRAAAEAVGMSRVSAYRLRERAGAESFAAAWDAALYNMGRIEARKVTEAELWLRAMEGLVRPRLSTRLGDAIVWNQDNKSLLRLMRIFARAGGHGLG